MASSCRSLFTVTYEKEVEIAPGAWLTVYRDVPASRRRGDVSAVDEQTLRFDWNGKRVERFGREALVTLREHDNVLYLITLNRLRVSDFYFVFYQLDERGTGFEPIDVSSFPRQVATQNMLLNSNARFIFVGDHEVDTWKVLRTLDIESGAFVGSMTAKILRRVEGGMRSDLSFVDREFLRDYVRKYEPIPLPTLVKEE